MSSRSTLLRPLMVERPFSRTWWILDLDGPRSSGRMQQSQCPRFLSVILDASPIFNFLQGFQLFTVRIENGFWVLTKTLCSRLTSSWLATPANRSRVRTQSPCPLLTPRVSQDWATGHSSNTLTTTNQNWWLLRTSAR